MTTGLLRRSGWSSAGMAGPSGWLSAEAEPLWSIDQAANVRDCRDVSLLHPKTRKGAELPMLLAGAGTGADLASTTCSWTKSGSGPHTRKAATFSVVTHP